jgi:AmiR/NasT family two-component response regulator
VTEDARDLLGYEFASVHRVRRHDRIDVAAVALDAARRYAFLDEAIAARTMTGRAQGILMERFDLSDDEALSVLLRHSQDNNIKLHETSQHIVASGELPQRG